MYYAHFGLKQPPFKITPNTEFFFSGGNRGAVLDALIYAIDSGEGIIKVVGEVGSGKTMLCRMLQTLLPEKVESIYLANPSVAPEDVLHAIAFELQLKLPKNADRLQVMQVLQTYLLKRHAEGKQVVIFVEEAQGMPLATLEEIRLLSNLETKNDKLLQIVLFGQPELDTNLNQSHIRQLRERITHSFSLGPLTEKETGEYLIFRLRAAGYFGPHLFTPSAIRKLSRSAEGLVRRVNILADKALLAAFSENVYQVTTKQVRAAIRDSEFGAAQAKQKSHYGWYAGMAIVLLAGVGLGYLAYGLSMGSHPPVTIDNTAHQPPVMIKPTAEAPMTAAPAAMPVAQAQSAEPIKAASPEPAPALPVAASSVASSTPAHTVEAAAVTPAAQNEQTTQSLLQQRLDAGQAWLKQSPESTVTVQLMGGNDDQQMEGQLSALGRQLNLDKIYLFRTTEGGRPFMIVTYGSYPNWNAAAQARRQLPRSLQANQPKLRSAAGIMKETK
ncbi:MAG TPA: AAA family ATPase [Methylophilaceae bacterium]|nr:AAA family ATPase [Methylophilaceae bacterium]